MRRLSTFFFQILSACLLGMLIAQHVAIGKLVSQLEGIEKIARQQDGWVYFDLVKEEK